MRQVLVYSLESNGEQAAGIDLSLDKLEKWKERHREDAQDEALESPAGHVISIVQRKPKLDGLTVELLSIPILQRVDEVQHAYDEQFAMAIRATDLYRAGLYLLCVLLVLALAILFSRSMQRTGISNTAWRSERVICHGKRLSLRRR